MDELMEEVLSDLRVAEETMVTNFGYRRDLGGKIAVCRFRDDGDLTAPIAYLTIERVEEQ